VRIAKIGTGYVGLVTGVCLADFGNNIICVDNDKEKIDILNKGQLTCTRLAGHLESLL